MTSTASRAGRTEDGMKMRTITLEEHYATPAFMDGPGRQIKEQAHAAEETREFTSLVRRVAVNAQVRWPIKP
jgi:hypothetical protein